MSEIIIMHLNLESYGQELEEKKRKRGKNPQSNKESHSNLDCEYTIK